MATLLWTAAGVLALAALWFLAVFLPRGMRWGATNEERERPMAGDAFLEGEPPGGRSLRMTRAISIAAAPDVVWPWVAQLGRGAGFYSYDRLDNGGRTSARHVVSWIPEPRLGDASAIGYLRHVDPGREVAWWVTGERFLAAVASMVIDIALEARGGGTRLVVRVSGRAHGWTSPFALALFAVVDTLMARRQLLGLRERAERFGARPEDPERPETGARDQYQFYETLYADGEGAGVAGKEGGARWRALALVQLGDRMGAASSVSSRSTTPEERIEGR